MYADSSAARIPNGGTVRPVCEFESPAMHLNDGQARQYKLLMELEQRLAPVLRPEIAKLSNASGPIDRPPTIRDYAAAAHRLADEIEGLLARIDL